MTSTRTSTFLSLGPLSGRDADRNAAPREDFDGLSADAMRRLLHDPFGDDAPLVVAVEHAEPGDLASGSRALVPEGRAQDFVARGDRIVAWIGVAPFSGPRLLGTAVGRGG